MHDMYFEVSGMYSSTSTHPIRLGVLPLGRVHVVKERRVVLIDGRHPDLDEGVDHVGVAGHDALQVGLGGLLGGGVGGEQASGEGRPRILPSEKYHVQLKALKVEKCVCVLPPTKYCLQ